MGQLRLNILVIVLVGLSPVLSFGGAEEPPPPGEGICYKVFYEAYPYLLQFPPVYPLHLTSNKIPKPN